ncbi:MAG TPA: flagellar assembly protein FliW [Candidatus Kapabacteria bacterium]|nr:flagellar assembly protein FliW [Candidatus Kapabacteria bacterium]
MNDKTNKEVTIQTPHFGKLTVNEEMIFLFDNGMLGFEDLTNFVVVSEDESAPFKWLISIEKPEIGFPMLSPWLIDLNYSPGNHYDIEKQVFFVVVTLENENGKMTANMKAPVILDTENLKGEQIILPFDKYSTNYVIEEK